MSPLSPKRRSIVIPIALFALIMPASSLAIDQTTDGFVTRISSAMSFEVGSTHFAMTNATKCSVSLHEGPIYIPNEWYGTAEVLYPRPKGILAARIEGPVHYRTGSIPCDTKWLHIGSRIRIRGAVKSGTTALAPAEVDIFEIAKHAPSGVAQVDDEVSHAEHSSEEGAGYVWIDGYPLLVTGQTEIVSAPKDTAVHYVASGFGPVHVSSSSSRQAPGSRTPSVRLRENDWANYGSTLRSDGSLIATRFLIWRSQGDSKEENYIRRFSPHLEMPDYGHHIPGQVFTDSGMESARILPDRGTQGWISRLGAQLVEASGTASARSANSIDFRFYVTNSIQEVQTGYFVAINGTLPNFSSWGEAPLYVKGTILAPESDHSGEIFVSPDGLILLPDRLLSRLHDSAEVAAILSFGIDSVLQRQGYRAWPEIMSPEAQKRIGLQSWAFFDSFGLWQEEQQIRLGIRRMLLAGYDIREAAFVWTLAAGKAAANPVFNAEHPDQEFPWYTTYAFDYISQFYSDVDYNKLKRGEKEYAQFLDELRKADPEAFAMQK